MTTDPDEGSNSEPGRDMPDPGFTFSDFDFQEFADWLVERHGYCAQWLMDTADVACEEMDDDSPVFKAYRSVGLSVAIDTAYLAMLSLAIADSVREDLLDGVFPPQALIEAEPFRRARYMLKLHADYLPVRIDDGAGGGEPSMLDQRAGAVASILMPVSMHGFDGPDPVIQNVARQMPAEVRATLESHEHAEMPLVQMMAVSFWLAFRVMVADGSPSLQWQRVLDDFWEGWTHHLLDVDYVLREEDLQANEKLDEESLQANGEFDQ